jgi:hypothetical protein
MRFPVFLLGLFVATVLSPGDLQAQSSATHGSIYSGLGIGERLDFHSSQSAMMGGAGTALPIGFAVSLANPALWSDQVLVRLSVGAEVQGLRAEDSFGRTARLGSGHPTGLQVSLPLLPNRLGVAAALRPYTRVNYYVVDDGTLIVPDLPRDTVNYRVHLTGGGGLQEAQFGFGWRFSSALSVGVSGRALFGVIENQQRTEYLAPNQFPETLITRRTRMWGFGATIGGSYRATGVLSNRDLLNLGVALTLPTNLQGRRTATLGHSLDQDTLMVPMAGSVQIPLSLSTGLSYAPDSRWTVALDVRYEPWSAFTSDLPFAGYNPTTGEDRLKDRLRLGGGFEILPAGADRSAPFLSRTAYRLGAYVDRGYMVPADHSVSTMALTGGLSMPSRLGATRFDLGFELGARGTTDHGLVRDLFLKGTATINFGERWFIRRQFG